jgi:hypothetical protein
VLVALNMSTEAQTLDPPPGELHVLADSAGDAGRQLPAGPLQLEPFQALLVDVR